MTSACAGPDSGLLCPNVSVKECNLEYSTNINYNHKFIAFYWALLCTLQSVATFTFLKHFSGFSF